VRALRHGLVNRMVDFRFRRASYAFCWIVFAVLGAHVSPVAAAEPMLMFSTQDANGFYMITFGHGAVAVRGRTGKTPVDRIEDYPAQKAQRLWNDIDRLAKDGLNGPVDPAHLHPELNYVILLQASDGTRTDLSFPKCAHNARVDEVMKRLAAGLLPDGSPGIYPGTCTSDKAS
jgi:hypothetical protein